MAYVLVKALQRVCTENTAQGGVSRQIQNEVQLSAVFVLRNAPDCCIFVCMSVSGAGM